MQFFEVLFVVFGFIALTLSSEEQNEQKNIRNKRYNVFFFSRWPHSTYNKTKKIRLPRILDHYFKDSDEKRKGKII